jgi:prevent-host-death family protein
MIDPSCPFRLKPRWNHAPRSDSNPVGQRFGLTFNVYIMYSYGPGLILLWVDAMKAATKKGAEQARRNFPALVEQAARGEPTIITKHGKPYAALVPASYLGQNVARVDIRALRGSGKGLWGRSIKRTIRSMREEWR